MKEKQKTCITVIGRGVAINTFNESINIPHNVDIIHITSIGGIILNNNAIVGNAFYIRSNLVTNIHDQILGVFGNLSYQFSNSGEKTFRNLNRIITGTYTFEILNFDDGTLINYNEGVTVYINIEFIELEKD